MIQSYTSTINTGNINLSEPKEKFLEEVLREISPELTDKQYNRLKVVITHCLSKIEILDPLRGYDERLEDECKTLLKVFIDTKRLEGKSEKTLSYYQSSIRKLFEFLDEKPVSLITADDVRSFLSYKITEDGASMITANNMRRIYSSFFNWCFNEEYIMRSPMGKVKPFKEPTIVKKEFSDRELERLRKAINRLIYTNKEGSVAHELGLRRKAIMELLNSAGIRVGELVGLNYGDINFQNNTAIVFGKGSKERRIFFTDKAKVYLEDYLKQRKENSGHLELDEPLFTSAHKPRVRLGISGVETDIRNLGDVAGVEKCHPHRFRRTFATRMIRKGMPLEKVQKLMGHVNTETTMIYVNVSDKGLAYEYDKYID